MTNFLIFANNMKGLCTLLAFSLLFAPSGSFGAGLQTGYRKITRIADGENVISGSQVWSITCTDAGSHPSYPTPVVFLASNDGLFTYNGARLSRHHPGYNIRDIVFDSKSGRLYSAASEGFGWWDKDGQGRMTYHPIEDNQVSKANQDYWRVCLSSDRKVYFQSLERVCVFDPSGSEVRVIFPKTQFRYMHGLDGRILIQDGTSLCEILPDDTMRPVCRSDDRIMDIVRLGGRTIVAQERTGLMVLTDRGVLRGLHKESNAVLSQAKILSIAPYGESSLLVGTTQGGIFMTDADGRIRDDFLMEEPFSGATVLSVAMDTNGDIWTGMEAGAARIDFSSQDYYIEDQRLGRVRAAVELSPETLLIGSNKGAFICKDNSIRPVPGSTGSVWNIAAINGKTYIAHDLGLFRCSEEGVVSSLFSETGVMSIEPYIIPGLFVCGTYNGLAIFEDKGEGPRFRNTISGYDGYCRNIHIDSCGRIWARDSRKGFIRLTLDESLTRVDERKDFELIKGDGDHLFACAGENGLLFCCNSNAWEIDSETAGLVPSAEGNSLLACCGPGVQSIVYNNGAWWYMAGSGCGVVAKDADGVFHKKGSILSGQKDIRNASGLAAYGKGIICGFLNEIGISYGPRSIQESIGFSHIQLLGSHRQTLADIKDGEAEIPFDMNSVRIFAGGNLNDDVAEYRVLPNSKEWKIAQLHHPILLSSLPSGNYEVAFRAIGKDDVSCSFRLHVLRPWYLKWWMIVFYAVTVLFLAAGVRWFYLRKAEKERQSMLKKMEEERLRSDLKEKSKELANITFNNAKRNNQLKEIKELLSSADPLRRSMDIKKVSAETIHLIDSYLGDESDWEKSEEYFNLIYDGLLDKLKKVYPGISKTDLKICVYAKLNLSTKEIADIMNVSPRSVEMARWRLRKRLGLPLGQDIGDILKEL